MLHRLKRLGNKSEDQADHKQRRKYFIIAGPAVCHVIYQPSPAFTPSISAIIRATQEELMAWVQPCRIDGMAWGIATRNTSWPFAGRPEFWPPQEKVLVHIGDSGQRGHCDGKPGTQAMINTAPANREEAITIITGIQVEVGIGPRNLMTGSTQ